MADELKPEEFALVPKPEPVVVIEPKKVVPVKDDGSLSPFSVTVGQVYDGPMDLLLDLIRKQNLDIYDIPMGIITAQFLEYCHHLKNTDVDAAGEFVYTASLLIHIKSKLLLPREPSDVLGGEAEDPRRELVERLLEHERFKAAAQMLAQKQMVEDAGDVAAVQLRLKGADDAAWRHAIEVLRPVAQSRGVALLLNDRVDLVREHGCDGAHVGQQDMAAREARTLLGPDLTLGVTCHASRDLAMQAGEDGADYVAFGAFFASATKPDAALADVEVIAWWAELMELPCVAIGGITPDNCAPLVEAGADFLAVCDAVWGHPEGPAAGVRAMHATLG